MEGLGSGRGKYRVVSNKNDLYVSYRGKNGVWVNHYLVSVILLSIVEKRAQRYTFNSLLPNILANKFYLDSKKKVKGVWYPRIFRLIPVKRTEVAIVNNK